MRSLFRVATPGLLVLTVACSGPVVVNTGESTPPTAVPPPTSVTTTRPSNVHLANAFDFVAEVDGTTGYYFVSPSGRWECAIVPRVSAGCQNAQSAAIGIADAPDEVPGPDGEPTAPNALIVDSAADAHFAAIPAPGFGLEAEEATVLPFNRILAVTGFRCNVQEASGISCLSEFSGKGFTFSADGYTLQYTDVPADAP